MRKHWHIIAGWILLESICLYPLGKGLVHGNGFPDVGVVDLLSGCALLGAPVLLMLTRSKLGGLVLLSGGIIMMGWSAWWTPFDGALLTLVAIWLLGRNYSFLGNLHVVSQEVEFNEVQTIPHFNWLKGVRLTVRIIVSSCVIWELWELCSSWPSNQHKVISSSALASLVFLGMLVTVGVIVAVILLWITKKRFPSVLGPAEK